MTMLLNAFLLAFRELRRSVLRSSLTTLVIVIGVAAAIIMVTLGNGATKMVASDIASLGSNLLTLMPGQRMGPGGNSGNARAFRQKDVDVIERDVPDLAAVAAIASQTMNAIAGNRNWSTNVTGTTNAYFKSGNWALQSGRFFNDAEQRGGRAVCVVGQTVRQELFGSADPVGERLRLRGVSCEVVGVLRPKGKSSFGQDRDDTVVMPLRTFQRRIAGDEDVRQIQMSVAEAAATDRTQREVERLMRERRRLGPTDDNDFNVMDQQDIAATLTGTTRTLTLLLVAVAGVSLLVGGIGIMNIMVVSVTERTREIGIRMAIGALEREVLLRFLIEAVVLSAFGGLIGVCFALGVSALLAYALSLPFAIDLSVVLLAFSSSAIIGIVFGFVPARRAASLNPIDALRHE
ncbi:MAG: ABC transporter permease [Vicinamibacterales bacterium]